jgi:hypothetical protein
VDSLKSSYQDGTDLQGLIRSVTYLIRGAIFRSNHETDSGSQNICPLGELIDMYHAHEAARPHDKVYALLGMSSDDLSRSNILPNYNISWKELLRRLVKFLLPEDISVETWAYEDNKKDSKKDNEEDNKKDNEEDNRKDEVIAVIKSKGCILG